MIPVFKWNKEVLFYGENKQACIQKEYNAGRLILTYENGFIRSIKLGQTEIIRMMYSAVRDHNWGTLDYRISNEVIEYNGKSFSICYKINYEDVFEAFHTIIGNEEGRIEFTIEGNLLRDFQKNRIGICVLHPIEECAGMTCLINEGLSDETLGTFPEMISPTVPFTNITSMNWQTKNGITSSLQFKGDNFETEDQRNWTDASFKTYCTPLSHLFPVLLKKGDRIEQKVTLKILEYHDEEIDSIIKTNEVILNKNLSFSLPKIGLSENSFSETLKIDEIEFLKSVKINHYRSEIYLSRKNWENKLCTVFEIVRKIDTKLELCLFVSEDISIHFPSQLMNILSENENLIFSIILLDERKPVLNNNGIKELVAVLRNMFKSCKIGAGTNANFAELNRNRFETELLDFISFSINPQVHANDNQTLIENIAAQEYAVISAKEFSGNAKIHISPITLKKRFNAVATSISTDPEDKLTGKADPRQMSLFTMGWTIDSILSLAKSGTQSVTYFETTGYCGIMQGEVENKYPNQFFSIKGMLFPIYHLFKFLGNYIDCKIVSIKPICSLDFTGFVICKGNENIIIISNLKNENTEIKLMDELKQPATVLKFNQITYSDFAFNSEYISTGKIRTTIGNKVLLLPYETLIIQ